MNARRSHHHRHRYRLRIAEGDADDVLALILAMSIPGLEIAAITPVGEFLAERASHNLHGFLSRAGMASIPHAWVRQATRSPVEDRIGSVGREPGDKAVKPEGTPRIDSVDLILKTLAEAPTPLTIVAIGPLTNLGWPWRGSRRSPRR